MNPATNPRPPIKNTSPAKNCSHKLGKGAWRIPNVISRINLIPKAASAPGMTKMMRAIIRIINKSFRLTISRLLYHYIATKTYYIVENCQGVWFSYKIEMKRIA